MRATALCLALLTAGALLTSATAQAAPAPCAWQATPLELPAGYGQAYAQATDHHDLVVGQLVQGVREDIVLWRGGKATVLGRPFGLTGLPTAMSTSGAFAGLLARENGKRHGFRHRDGEFERLELPPGADLARPQSINAAGEVVSAVNGQLVHWPVGAPVQVLAPPVPGEVADPYLDDEGRIAFTLYTEGRAEVYLRHTDGRYQELLPPEASIALLARQSHAGRVLGHVGPSTTVVWGVDGAVQQRIEETSHAVNGSGAVLTEYAGSVYRWQDGRRGAALPWQFRPDTENGLLEDGSVIGSMRTGSTGPQYPAHLRCQ